MANVLFMLNACVDCLVFLANGEEPPERPNLRAEIEKAWPFTKWVLEPACDEESEGWFSWSPCDVCGSALGGERHVVVATEKE